MLKQTAVAASLRRPKRRTKEKRKMVAPIDPMLWHKVAAVSGNEPFSSRLLPRTLLFLESCFLNQTTGMSG